MTAQRQHARRLGTGRATTDDEGSAAVRLVWLLRIEILGLVAAARIDDAADDRGARVADAQSAASRARS